MQLSSALDNDVLIAVQRFLENGVQGDPDSLYTAFQRSNSSLKRKPKKVICGSIERVLEYLNVQSGAAEDSDQELEKRLPNDDRVLDAMNRDIRHNLLPPTQSKAHDSHDTDESRQRRRQANGEPLPKRQKAEKLKLTAPSGVSIDEIGGMEDVITQMRELLVVPLLHPERYQQMSIKLPTGVLLHGPPGCGKTMLSRAFAGELGVPFIEILGPSVVSSMSGDSEKALRERFDEAKKNAPCLIFIDEIDAIAPKRESSNSQMEKRIVAQLLISMDDLQRDATKPVIVLAATNLPDNLDPALRRGGRFDTEINIGVPNEKVREQILRFQTRKSPISDDVDYLKLAKLTAGFVGGDLHDLVGKAGAHQMKLYREALEAQGRELEGQMQVDSDAWVSEEVKRLRQLILRVRRTDLPQPPGFEKASIMMADFLAVLPAITPSLKREGFTTVPDVSWDDIGALDAIREELKVAIIDPILNPSIYADLGLSAPAGVLLWGPPGCGKTLLAKAVATESKANFISVKGPELFDKFVGESEAAVRRVFTRARSSVPCVIFFDELDALVPRRDTSESTTTARVVNMLLTELDGLNHRDGIYVIGATNRPDMIDPAMMRPGRLETPLFVDLPSAADRGHILRAIVRSKPVHEVEAIVGLVQSSACDGYSGADLSALLRQASQHAVRRKGTQIILEDFQVAITKIKPSVTNMAEYYRLREAFT